MVLDYETMPDDELASRVRKRGAVDERAMAILFQRHHGLVWNVCRRFMQADSDAEDMLQEVFLRAYQGLPAFKGQSRFSTWIYRIAVNVCLNEIRRRKRRVEVHETPIEELSARFDQHQLRDAHQQQRMSEELAAALASLPNDAREAVYLREYEGREYAEIAQIQGITTGAAKMRVQRARLAMLVYLSDQQE